MTNASGKASSESKDHGADNTESLLRKMRKNLVSRSEFIKKGTILGTGVLLGGLSRPRSAEAPSYVNLQSSTPGTAQTGHFNITGTGIVGTLSSTGTATNLFSGNVTLNNQKAFKVKDTGGTERTLGTVDTYGPPPRILLGDTSAQVIRLMNRVEVMGAAGQGYYLDVRDSLAQPTVKLKGDIGAIDVMDQPGDVSRVVLDRAGGTFGYNRVFADKSTSSPNYYRGYFISSSTSGNGTFDHFFITGTSTIAGPGEVGGIIASLTTSGSGQLWGGHFQLTRNTTTGNIIGHQIDIYKNTSGGFSHAFVAGGSGSNYSDNAFHVTGKYNCGLSLLEANIDQYYNGGAAIKVPNDCDVIIGGIGSGRTGLRWNSSTGYLEALRAGNATAKLNRNGWHNYGLQIGQQAINIATGENWRNVSVSFPRTFYNAPRVFLTYDNDWPGARIFLKVHSVTTTGFNIQFITDDGRTDMTATTVNVNWLAIDQEMTNF